MANDLAIDTAVQHLQQAPGWYTASLPDAWSYTTPSGGVLMTVAMRAMQAEIADPALKPISATALFCSPVPAGPLEIRVELLRRGSAAAQVRAALSSTTAPGPGLEVSATFGRDRAGPDLLDGRPPAVPRPSEARPFEESNRRTGTRFPFMSNFESRLATDQPWWEPGFTGGEARFARWLRYLVPQRLEGGGLDPLAVPPIADMMPVALIQGLGPGAPPMRAPSLDLTVHFIEPARSEWLLVATHARRAWAGYASAEAEIWSEDGRLVAYATQTMMLRAIRR